MNRLMIVEQMNTLHSKECISNLESGKILFFPDCYYECVNDSLLSESILHPSHKNVSYDYKKDKLGAIKKGDAELEGALIELMRGYAEYSMRLIEKALPDYAAHVQWGRTSYRPAQIKGRSSSKRKDDTRLHVDSFVASPVNGLRILRVFCNVNPHKEPRVWNIGEPFTKVLERFSSQIPDYKRWIASLLKSIKVTKSLRSSYDHYMLHLHDAMKTDDDYQANVAKTQIDFPAQSSWIVFTDHVSHAALSGQYLLEQTFYLPVEYMDSPDLSPLSEWKKLKQISC